MEAYSGFAKVYDLFMDNVPYEAWSEYLVQILKKYQITDGIVLDLACGTGKMTRLLAKRGYDMIGIDASAEMLEAAMAQEDGTSGILYLNQDMREFELYGTVRAVISICDSINYIMDEEDLRTVFSLVNNYLDPGGIFIFDLNTLYKYQEVLGEATICENREDGSFIWENYYDRDARVNEYDLTFFVREEDGRYQKYQETHMQRGYALETVRKLLEEAGMEFVACYGENTYLPPEEDAERIYIIARECTKEHQKAAQKLGNEEIQMDSIVRATAADGQIRAFAVTSKELTEKARIFHNTSPIMTAALGRLMAGAVMMGVMMKGEKDLLTIQIQCSGPAKGLTVTADANGRVKGYPEVPDVILPANAKGKLDVGGALGLGVMSVIKDLGMKEPYIGQIELKTGEIADDLTYYFASSEQIPSSVGLGVLMNKDNTVKRAGGFIIQLMPFTEEATIQKLEKRIGQLSSITSLLEKGDTPELLLKEVLGDIPFEVTDTIPAEFHCDCSKERIAGALATISKKDLDEMIASGESIEVKCHFCNTKYEFRPEELKEIRN